MQLLPTDRVGNTYCQSNTTHSMAILSLGSGSSSKLRSILRRIKKIEDSRELRDFMQKGYTGDPQADRRVLWNFDNICPRKSGSIEFRGAPGLKNAEETRKWCTFTTAFVKLCIIKVRISSEVTEAMIDDMY